MKRLVNLSPERVDAILAIQNDIEILIPILNEVSEFILDVEVEDDKAATALYCLKNIREVQRYLRPFEKGRGNDEN